MISLNFYAPRHQNQGFIRHLECLFYIIYTLNTCHICPYLSQTFTISSNTYSPITDKIHNLTVVRLITLSIYQPTSLPLSDNVKRVCRCRSHRRNAERTERFCISSFSSVHSPIDVLHGLMRYQQHPIQSILS